MLEFERHFRYDELLLVFEMLLEEKENHISAAPVVRRVHRHLSEEILDVRHDDGERTKSVPKVVESEYGLVACTSRLVFEADK